MTDDKTNLLDACNRQSSMVNRQLNMKSALAIALTFLLAVGAVYHSYRQRNRKPEEPESAIWRMLESSRGGDVRGYLECFTGRTRTQLEATVREMTPAKFAGYLRETSGAIKGVAVYDVQRTGEGAAGFVVEYVYQNQNEKQRMSLTFENGLWRILSAEVSQQVQPLIPYGKPVTEAEKQ